MSRLRLVAVSTILFGLGLGAGGCAVVRPYQRQDLARRSMTQDRGKGEVRADEHRASAREGAAGGTGDPGGGCGCN
ncbi:MAG TPA: DUF4266 domain-containing protein [Kofleriaceae bacterium]|nr:DUF4266 domain-containing protein [Kofleriaceae bacterium]